MPESRLERTRKLYADLNIKLPDTSKPSWWTQEYEDVFQAAVKVGRDVLNRTVVK